MNDRAALWSAAAELVASGEPAALATVARKRGSLPLADDAKMLVTAAGRRLGTVGGGCVEADVVHQALETVEKGRPAVVKHTLNADVAGDIGLSCGGTVELFLEPLPPSEKLARLCRGVAESVERRRQVTVFTALDWERGPRKLARTQGEAWAIGDWSGTVPWPTAGRRTAFLHGESGLFVEPIPRTPRLIVFGAGHVGAEIAKVAAGAGFHVVIVDDRADFANRQRIPWAAGVIAEDFNAVLDTLTFDADDSVIAATRGHSFDAMIVERTAGSAAGYVGMLGSQRKWAVIRRALEAAGIPKEPLDRVRCPIGEAIGADTPAEIGVSVVAELIWLRWEGQMGQVGRTGQ
ncbi:MAG: XdhC family protein [Gemmatimonadetes bacterium]|nr:XdhC family protein [Gemmatimonadota bacterium]